MIESRRVVSVSQALWCCLERYIMPEMAACPLPFALTRQKNPPHDHGFARGSIETDISFPGIRKTASVTTKANGCNEFHTASASGSAGFMKAIQCVKPRPEVCPNNGGMSVRARISLILIWVSFHLKI
jgi:hypothetical protein